MLSNDFQFISLSVQMEEEVQCMMIILCKYQKSHLVYSLEHTYINLNLINSFCKIMHQEICFT